MKKDSINKSDLINELAKIDYKAENEAQETLLSEMNFSGVLLKLVDIDPENEYKLCHDVAKRLLGTVYESIDPEIFE